jgi:hypothetical protein
LLEVKFRKIISNNLTVNGINTSYTFEAVNGVNTKQFEAVNGINTSYTFEVVNGVNVDASQPTVAKTSEGAHTACRFIFELDAPAKDARAVLQPTLASVPTPHFEGAGAQSGRQEDSERVRAAESHSGQMIVDSVSEGNSKIFLILQNDHAIFCEGE